MAEAALRFGEPETIARDAVVTVGQAIRREVAAMGDGVERALARAAELETLVNNEVAALERAYNDNEMRIATCSTASPSSAKHWSAKPSKSAMPSPMSTSTCRTTLPR